MVVFNSRVEEPSKKIHIIFALPSPYKPESRIPTRRLPKSRKFKGHNPRPKVRAQVPGAQLSSPTCPNTSSLGADRGPIAQEKERVLSARPNPTAFGIALNNCSIAI